MPRLLSFSLLKSLKGSQGSPGPYLNRNLLRLRSCNGRIAETQLTRNSDPCYPMLVLVIYRWLGADKLSKELARRLVVVTVECKSPTHEKGKFQSLELVKCQAEKSTIIKAQGLIRTLYLNEVNSECEWDEIQRHLTALFDRLIRRVCLCPALPRCHSIWKD